MSFVCLGLQHLFQGEVFGIRNQKGKSLNPAFTASNNSVNSVNSVKSFVDVLDRIDRIFKIRGFLGFCLS